LRFPGQYFDRENGDNASMEVLPFIYRSGGFGLSQDPQKSEYWALKASEPFLE
jgi:hypothetical protein